ncbi:carbonic anhydrase [Chitinophaga sp. CF118]|uniref:carbonic anhydrase family protein n=1 Tax=Chitinophaga sp. CF118 TaxID=1884367 RepID=UPI0008E28226|nr:carbonic anhydrase family protein [Chitinophaga sp. CF118]SFD51245.1 carbonic anhydrase [Chitinophaga sp. CF118]
MRKNNLMILVVIGVTTVMTSCKNGTAAKQNVNSDTASKKSTATEISLRKNVLTAEEQKAFTPDSVLQNLKAGNKRFVMNDLTKRDHSAMVRNAYKAQYPKAVVISCLDSRVPVEDVFDKGIGDLFVGRVAGNFVNEDLLGSLEYGCKVSGAKLIVVLGHRSCGAIKAAIDNVKLGNITAMLAKIEPAVVKSQDFKGEKTSKNDDFVEYVTKNNVINTIETIRSKSPILKEMEDKGEIKIVGAFYDLKTGEVIFL